MKNLCSVIVFFFLLFFIKSIYAQSAGNNNTFIWGINGHALSERVPYNNAIDEQLENIKRVGFTYYRNDIAVGIDGKVSNANRFIELLNKAQEKGIKILPMIYDCWNPALSNQQNYQNGYALGLNFIKGYAKYISAVEIGNEKDVAVIGNTSLIKSAIPADGQLTSHYDRVKANSLAACFDGMADGIHAGKATVKVIIDCSNHPRWGFFKIMQEQKVSYDIIGIHWYTSSGSITNIYGQNGINMFAQFNKPLWITEINRGGGSYGEGGDTEASALQSLYDQVRPYKAVKAFFVYELYDNDDYKKQNNIEGFFGIYTDPSKEKPSVALLRKLISTR